MLFVHSCVFYLARHMTIALVHLDIAERKQTTHNAAYV
jgi:hypothetical protein